MLTKLFMGGRGLILRPAHPPFLCHNPLEGRTPNQRLRPAFPMISLLWSTLDTRPTVTMHVSSTCGREGVFGLGERAGAAESRPSGKPHLHLALRRELNDGGSVHFTQQDPARPFRRERFREGRRNAELVYEGGGGGDDDRVVPVTTVITCSADVLGSLPGPDLQVVDQRSHRKCSQRVRVPLVSRHWGGYKRRLSW